jgi:hypothetical protein
MSLRIPYNSLQSSKKMSSNKSLKKGSNTKKNINGDMSQAHSFFHSTKSKDVKNSTGLDVFSPASDNQLDANEDVVIIEEGLVDANTFLSFSNLIKHY